MIYLIDPSELTAKPCKTYFCDTKFECWVKPMYGIGPILPG